MRRDYTAAPPPYSSINECRSLVRSWPAKEQARAFALSNAYVAAGDAWRAYLNELEATGLDRHAIGGAIRAEASQTNKGESN